MTFLFWAAVAVACLNATTAPIDAFADDWSAAYDHATKAALWALVAYLTHRLQQAEEGNAE